MRNIIFTGFPIIIFRGKFYLFKEYVLVSAPEANHIMSFPAKCPVPFSIIDSFNDARRNNSIISAIAASVRPFEVGGRPAPVDGLAVGQAVGVESAGVELAAAGREVSRRRPKIFWRELAGNFDVFVKFVSQHARERVVRRLDRRVRQTFGGGRTGGAGRRRRRFGTGRW